LYFSINLVSQISNKLINLESLINEQFSIKDQFDMIIQGLESAMMYNKLEYIKLDRYSFIDFLRFFIADSKSIKNKTENIEACIANSIELLPAEVRMENENFEVLSLLEIPAHVYASMTTQLLTIESEFCYVINFNLTKRSKDLDSKMTFLKGAFDAISKRQAAEILHVQEKMAHGTPLAEASICFILKNKEKEKKSHIIKNIIYQKTGMIFYKEIFMTPLLFLSCLPLSWTITTDKYLKRHVRTLSDAFSCLLPVFGGFKGCSTKSQIMYSRAMEPIWLSSRDNQTSPHVVVLASSGGGKSFWLANYLLSEKALYPDSIDFIIDNKTSYACLCEFLGGTIVKPPHSFPNIFACIDDDTINIIVGILRTAISLTSKVDLQAEHTMVMATALRLAHDAKELDTKMSFSAGAFSNKKKFSYSSPILSEIIGFFPEACIQMNVSSDLSLFLAQKLAPFYGKGPYAKIFDTVHQDLVDECSFYIYDLDGVQGDPILSILTTQAVIAEVVRKIKSPQNRGKKGRLSIEEAGVLGNNLELQAFIFDAWKTFRKLDVACIGLSNEVDDFRLKPACKTMWQISPTKILLKMSYEEIEKAAMEDKDRGIPRIFPEQIRQLMHSLQKIHNVSSDGVYWSNETVGSFTYQPTNSDL
jgi:type IV secretory pathway VirB4 component